MLLVYIALGGALGSLARYGIGGWIHSRVGAGLPWGTFVVNLTGSLLLGFLVRLLEGTAASAELRAFLTIGLLGAFTTFSTFSYETAMLVQDGEWGRALAYTLGSVALGLVGALFGFSAAAAVLRAGG